ncbi:hypothetical protein PHYPO_G00176470 [Pangasianodon hypophthalmus]|uniref:Secreted protein n=1 Tax=Pangasianodon hypophthalmus TaxID=310915 RepID=A0A5N5PPI0_PANHP|nr:hypothetical protein PHYPO_G00176470 [Pangasianodon hypophthalmus]
MRFYHSLTLSTLILIYLLSDNVLGASLPVSSKKGPRTDVTGPRQPLSSRAVNDNDRVKRREDSSETEESGDGSGETPLFNLPDLTRKRRDTRPQWLQQIQNEEEGSSFEVNYFDYITPVPVKPKLSAEDLREDNMIE